MITDDLRNIAADKGWEFSIGNRTTLNLREKIDTIGSGIALFVEPPKISHKYNQYGAVEQTTYKGNLLLLVLSDFDDGTDGAVQQDGGVDYIETKWENNVRPLVDEVRSLFQQITCDGGEIVQIDTEPFFNLFDWNADGLLVGYQIRV